MVRGTVKLKSPAGDNTAIRELMEMALEALGDPAVYNIREKPRPEGHVELTMDFIMEVPQGSRRRVEYCLTDFLDRFGPGRILTLIEEKTKQTVC